MRQNGLETAVKKMAEKIPVCGICGGYQMLGDSISDPEQVEEGGTIRGMELIPVVTKLQKEKVRCQTRGRINKLEGVFCVLSGLDYTGYEIHMGQTKEKEKQGCFWKSKDASEKTRVVFSGSNPNVYGTYIHGIFDQGSIAPAMVQALARKKGMELKTDVLLDYQSFKEKQYDKLADTLREYLNMEEIYGMLREAHLE